MQPGCCSKQICSSLPSKHAVQLRNTLLSPCGYTVLVKSWFSYLLIFISHILDVRHSSRSSSNQDIKKNPAFMKLSLQKGRQATNKRGTMHHILVARKRYVKKGNGKWGMCLCMYVCLFCACRVVCKLWIRFVGWVHREGDMQRKTWRSVRIQETSLMVFWGKII